MIGHPGRKRLLSGSRKVHTIGNSSLDALFRPYALIAVLLAGESLALIMALASEASGGRLILFGLASLGVQWVALGTLSALFLLRRPLVKLPSPAVAWICLLILLGMTLLVSSAAWGMLDVSAKPSEGKTSFVLRMLAIALVVGVLMLLTYQNYWRARQLAIRAKQLELKALQARIRPHFLFNTLNTGAALIHARPDEAERVLLDLADLFRAALRGPELITLSEELQLTHHYVEIEALRFGPRLRVDWRLPDPLPELLVPALSVQTLVENAVRHGIENLPSGGMIGIEVDSDDIAAAITIRNPVNPSIANNVRPGHSIGLQATRARILASTGDRGSLDAGQNGLEFVARIRLPIS